MVMDAETRARLKADFANESATSVGTPRRMDPETAARLKLEHSQHEQRLKNSNGAENFVNAFTGAIGDAGIGLAQATGQADPAAVKRMQARRADDTRTNAGQFGNVLGASVLPTAVGMGLPATLSKLGMAAWPVARNAIGGAASGAILPTMDGESRGANVAMSTALSAGPALAKKLFVQPVRPTAEAQMLIDNGIYPTPAQASGKLANHAESAATSMPLFGTAVSNARTQPFKEYALRRQRAFGYEGNKVGREATEEMGNISDQKYQNVIPKLMLEDTPALRAKYLRAQSELEPASREFNDVTRMIERKFDPVVAKSSAGIMGGEDLNKWQSQLRTRGDKFSNVNGDAFQNDLGDAYRKMREDTFDAIENQGLVGAGVPEEFRDARKYYAGMRNLIELGETPAAARRGGVFTPAEDLNWMRKTEGGQSSNAFGRNQVEDQRLAQAAVDTLGGVPDTGTAGRLSMLSFLKNPDLGWGEKALGVAGLPFATQPARKFAVGGYGFQKAMGKALREADNPYTFPGMAPYLTELENETDR